MTPITTTVLRGSLWTARLACAFFAPRDASVHKLSSVSGQIPTTSNRVVRTLLVMLAATPVP